MTRATGVVSRAAAERKADALLSRRAARFEQRERELRRLVADFHDAAQQAAKVRSDAQARAGRVLVDAEAKAAAMRERAEKDAAEFDAVARAAVQGMLEFGESAQSVRELTGLPAVEVRRVQRGDGATPQPQSGRAAAPSRLSDENSPHDGVSS